MAPRAVFKYKNLDSTRDINMRFVKLVGAGVYFGGTLAVVNASYSVRVLGFYAMNAEGMMVYDDDTNTVQVNQTGLQHIVLEASYNATGDAVISLRAVTDTDYQANKAKYIVFGSVDMDQANGGFVSINYVNYTHRTRTSTLGDNKFLGYFETDTARNTAYPTAQPLQKIGDYCVVGAGNTVKFSVWGGSDWLEFPSSAIILQQLNDHINNGSANSKHVTDNMLAALSGTSGSPSASNRYITQADTDRVLSVNERQALSGALGIGTGLNSLNPLVAQGTVIAVPKLFQTVGTGTTTLLLNRTVLGLTEFIPYIGKQGMDDNGVGASSARQYFALEDSVGNGYLDENGKPIYITDVTTDTDSILNPGVAANSAGFLDSLGAAGIKLVLSSAIANNAVVYVRLNLKGTLKELTPDWSSSVRYIPALTAFRQGKQSYFASMLGEFDTIVLGSRKTGVRNELMYTDATHIYHEFGVSTTPSGVIVTTLPNNPAEAEHAIHFNINTLGWINGTDRVGFERVVTHKLGVDVSGTLTIYGISSDFKTIGSAGSTRISVNGYTAPNGSRSIPAFRFNNNETTGFSRRNSYGSSISNAMEFTVTAVPVLVVGSTVAQGGLISSDAALFVNRLSSSTGVSIDVGAYDARLRFGIMVNDTFRVQASHVWNADTLGIDSIVYSNTAFSRPIGVPGAATRGSVGWQGLPGYTFNPDGANTSGLFYHGDMDFGSRTFKKLTGLSSNGSGVLLVTNDTETVSSTEMGFSGMLLNKYRDGTSNLVDIQMSLFAQDINEAGSLVFGRLLPSGQYAGKFTGVFGIPMDASQNPWINDSLDVLNAKTINFSAGTAAAFQSMMAYNGLTFGNNAYIIRYVSSTMRIGGTNSYVVYDNSDNTAKLTGTWIANSGIRIPRTSASGTYTSIRPGLSGTFMEIDVVENNSGIRIGAGNPMTTGVAIYGDGRIRFGSLQTSNTAILLGTAANANVGLGMDAVGSMYLHSDPTGWVFVDRLRLGNLVFSGDGSGNVGVNNAPATTGQLFVGAPANFTGGVIVSTGDMYVTSNFACSGVTTLNSVAADTVNVVSLLTASVASIQTLGVNNIETTSKPAGSVFAAPANTDGAAQWRTPTNYDQRILYSRMPVVTPNTTTTMQNTPIVAATLVSKSTYLPTSAKMSVFDLASYGIDVSKNVVITNRSAASKIVIKFGNLNYNGSSADHTRYCISPYLAFCVGSTLYKLFDPSDTVVHGDPYSKVLQSSQYNDGMCFVSNFHIEITIEYLGLIGSGGLPRFLTRICGFFTDRLISHSAYLTENQKYLFDNQYPSDLPMETIVNGVPSFDLKLGMLLKCGGELGTDVDDNIYHIASMDGPIDVEIIKPQQAW